MVLRDLAGGAARMSAGFWKEVARTLDPTGSPPPGSQRSGSSPPRRPSSSTAPQSSAGETPDGHPGQAGLPAPERATDGVLVPVDTWSRILEQLGHLHQAGQELAEARERAARAETQAEFLREQLAEAKAAARVQRRQPARSARTAPVVATPAPAAATPTRGAVVAVGRLPRARVAAARNRVSNWIRTD